MSISAHLKLIPVLACAVFLLWPADSLWAQEAESGLTPLPAEVAATLDGMIADIQLERTDIAAFDARLVDSDDFTTNILVARRDKIWTEMFDNANKLAFAVAAQQDNGVDVAEYMDKLREEFSTLPAQAYAALDRLKARVEFPTVQLPPNEFVVKDQQLFQAIEALDAIHRALISYISIAEKFDLDTTAELEYLNAELTEAGANRSVFLEMAITDVRTLRSVASILPEDADMAAWLSAAQARVQMAAIALQDTITLMNSIGLETRQYRRQVLTVTGEITTDILDVGIVGSLISEWSNTFFKLMASEGPRLIFRLLLVALILFAFFQLSKLVQKGAQKAMRSSRNRMSHLLSRMVISSARNLVMAVGILLAISQLGISLAPLLAGLGILGFIIGFALQDSLANFASGIMILMYRPFDVGDVVDAAGVRGRVSHMSLVNTTFMTLDNQRLVVPNNMIWQSVITNVTAQRTRRVDLIFGISYGDDIEKAEKVLWDILTKHEAVLDDPEPLVKVHELGESSVNFAVRPWVKTSNYWDTYWDLTREVKLRFDKEGISIPFPQRDVHVIEQKPA